ncbi:hypothetical protein ACLOJK_026435 [Asimina triloba]
MATIRIRSRDGLERIQLPNPPSATTLSDLKTHIESQLRVPVAFQTLSLNQNLLLAKTPSDLQTLSLDSSVAPTTPLSALNLANGSIVYLSYPPNLDRSIPSPVAFSPANTFGRNKMTIDDLIARQMRVTRQESPHCDSVSFDRDAANAFQHYINESLAFAVKRAGFMYGRVADGGRVEVDFIYEPPQQGTEEQVLLLRDSDEEALVEAVALGLGMRRVGFIFNQAVGQDKGDYTMSSAEVLQAAEMHAQSGLKEWVTAMVKLEVNEDGGTDVHFEAFQMSDMCVRLFKEEWFETEGGEGLDPKLSRMKKDVVVGGKDTREVDNDFFLVVVKILDHQISILYLQDGFQFFNDRDHIDLDRYFSSHLINLHHNEMYRILMSNIFLVSAAVSIYKWIKLTSCNFEMGPLSTSFPIENRMTSVAMRALKNHLDRAKHLPFVKRISDFHLLLLLARFLDVNSDVPALAECVQTQSPVPEGYQLLIEREGGTWPDPLPHKHVLLHRWLPPHRKVAASPLAAAALESGGNCCGSLPTKVADAVGNADAVSRLQVTARDGNTLNLILSYLDGTSGKTREENAFKQLYDLGYSPTITRLFRIIKNYEMTEYLKLEFLKLCGLLAKLPPVGDTAKAFKPTGKWKLFGFCIGRHTDLAAFCVVVMVDFRKDDGHVMGPILVILLSIRGEAWL